MWEKIESPTVPAGLLLRDRYGICKEPTLPIRRLLTLKGSSLKGSWLSGSNSRPD